MTTPTRAEFRRIAEAKRSANHDRRSKAMSENFEEILEQYKDAINGWWSEENVRLSNIEAQKMAVIKKKLIDRDNAQAARVAALECEVERLKAQK